MFRGTDGEGPSPEPGEGVGGGGHRGPGKTGTQGLASGVRELLGDHRKHAHWSLPPVPSAELLNPWEFPQ